MDGARASPDFVERVGACLKVVQLCLSALGLAGLMLFPLYPSLGALLAHGLEVLGTASGGLRVLFEAVDSSGQSGFSRSLLRCLLALCLTVLLLLPLPDWRSNLWSGLTLTAFFGLLSSMFCGHAFLALAEWETWCLLFFLAQIVALQWRRAYAIGFLSCLYVLLAGVFFEAVCSGFLMSSGRYGGIFSHPNALSTFCLMMLPSVLWRAHRLERDASLACFFSGFLLACLWLTGSLTGFYLLAGAAVYWSLAEFGFGSRLAAGLGSGGLLIALNLWKGWWSQALFLGILLGVWLLRGRRETPTFRRRGLTILLWTAVSLGLASALASAPFSESPVKFRSGEARWDFYQAAWVMFCDSPLLGTGPVGFSRYFPAYQGSLDYYSRFVHCLPLEFLSEWGLLAFCCLVGVALAFVRRLKIGALTPLQRVTAWSLVLGGLHTLTGVQSQFPYLVVMWMMFFALFWGEEENARSAGRESGVTRTTRMLLVALSLGIFVGNSLRAVAALERHLALIPLSNLVDGKSWPKGELLRSSFERFPLDSESARLWGAHLLFMGDRRGAREVADLCLSLDPRRASCILLALQATPYHLRTELLQRALESDPVNFPWFYVQLARQRFDEDGFEAFSVQSRIIEERFGQESLQSIPAYRREDLEDQLVVWWTVKSLVQDYSGRPEESLASLRKAVVLAERKPSRWWTLLTAPTDFSLASSKHLEHLAEQLRDQIPLDQIPASVLPSLNQARDLQPG